MKLKNKPLRALPADFIEDNGIHEQDVQDDLLLKWSRDFAKIVNVDTQWTQSIGLFTVEDYRAKLPENADTICEVAFRLNEPDTKCGSTREEVVQWVQDTYDGCELEINLVCPSCHNSECRCDTNEVIVDVDQMWLSAHPEYFYNTYRRVGRFGLGNSIYNPNFQILPLATGDYAQMAKHISGCANACVVNHTEYNYSLNLPYIETSFRDGELLVSYTGLATDDQGELMLPDHHAVWEAGLDYLTYKWFRMMWVKHRRQDDQVVYRDAKASFDISVGRALSALQLPTKAEFDAWLRGNRYYKMNAAYGNFLDPGSERMLRRKRTLYKG